VVELNRGHEEDQACNIEVAAWQDYGPLASDVRGVHAGALLRPATTGRPQLHLPARGGREQAKGAAVAGDEKVSWILRLSRRSHDTSTRGEHQLQGPLVGHGSLTSKIDNVLLLDVATSAASSSRLTWPSTPPILLLEASEHGEALAARGELGGRPSGARSSSSACTPAAARRWSLASARCIGSATPSAARLRGQGTDQDQSEEMRRASVVSLCRASDGRPEGRESSWPLRHRRTRVLRWR
jgi:hypothetical protein